MQDIDFFKNYRRSKIIQLTILILMGIFFFSYLFFHPFLAQSVYSNVYLFSICAMMWFVMIFTLLSIFFDFYQIREVAKLQHSLSKVAYLDHLSGIPNRNSCDLFFQMYGTEESLKDIGCILLQISNLVEINAAFGHEVGDRIIQDFCDILEDVGDRFGFVGRNSGNEFLTVIENCSKEKLEEFEAAFEGRIKIYNHSSNDAKMNVNISHVLNSDLHASRFSDIISAVYQKMFQ